LVGSLYSTFCFESTSLIAFGIAWLIKGETFLKDHGSGSPITETTDGHIMLGNPRDSDPA
jgi:hypothetical protein